ncbi:UBE2J2 [Symbiodinium microadriaticum]|nr:UBE2J2 [Symbiodinium microadriaticum]
MTDCRGLSEDEAKMLLELELLAAGATLATVPKTSLAPFDPQERPRSRRNLGSRMRAVKEEEEGTAQNTSFNIEVEYEADWTQEEGDGAAAMRPAETGRAIFCGSSDVSTATSSSAWPEDLQERLDAEEDEVHLRQKELAGRSERRSRRCGHNRDLAEEVTGQSAVAQPQVRILVRSAVAETKPCDEGRPAKKAVPCHQQEEDPWVSGLDPWAAATLPRATQKGQMSEPRRTSAPNGKGRRGNSRN